MPGLCKVVYGTPTDKCAVALRIGIERGFFEDEGLDLSVRVVFGGPEIAAAYDSGALEIGEMGSPPAINAIAAGKAFRIVASGCRQKAHMFFGAAKDIPVKDYQALKGRRIGMLGLGSCPDWIMRRILICEGLNPDTDVTFVPLLDDYPRVIDFLADGRIDACLVSEPNIAIGEERGLLNYWTPAFVEPYLPDYQWIVRVARNELIARDPELIRAVLRGAQRSAHYAVDHVDEWVAFAARQYRTTEAAARRAVERERPHFQLDCRIDMPGFERSVALQRELGGIRDGIQATDFLDLRFQPDILAGSHASSPAPTRVSARHA